MRVVCAWCRREGRPAFVCEKAPLGDDRETHSICQRHVHAFRSGRDPSIGCSDQPVPLRCESRLSTQLHPDSLIRAE